jgi:hypothetical protein
MNIQARIAHQTKGRVRLQLAQRRGDKEFFDRLSAQFADNGRVHKVRANPVTGSIVLEFTGALDDVLAGFAASLPIDLDRTPASTAASGRALLKQPDRPFRLVSGHNINPMAMAGTVFGAVGLLQTLRGKVMVPALSAFWIAANAFRLAARPASAQAAEADNIST